MTEDQINISQASIIYSEVVSDNAILDDIHTTEVKGFSLQQQQQSLLKQQDQLILKLNKEIQSLEEELKNQKLAHQTDSVLKQKQIEQLQTQKIVDAEFYRFNITKLKKELTTLKMTFLTQQVEQLNRIMTLSEENSTLKAQISQLRQEQELQNTQQQEFFSRELLKQQQKNVIEIQEIEKVRYAQEQIVKHQNETFNTRMLEQLSRYQDQVLKLQVETQISIEMMQEEFKSCFKSNYLPQIEQLQLKHKSDQANSEYHNYKTTEQQNITQKEESIEFVSSTTNKYQDDVSQSESQDQNRWIRRKGRKNNKQSSKHALW